MTEFIRFFKKRFILILTVLILVFISILELFSKRECADLYKNFESPCFDLMDKYAGGFNYIMPDEKDFTISDINNPEFFERVEKRTIYAPMSEVKANGIACLTHAFVASDLPRPAKRYVAIHENIHLEGQRNEARTNYLAAKLEPIGFVETVLNSLWLTLKNLKFNKLPCQLGGLWNIFKIYFLQTN